MLVSSGALPRGELRFEPKWDGFRGMVGVDGVAGSLRVETRSGRIVTSSVPELAPLALAVGSHQLVLDGELVAGDGSAESFYVLSGRMAAETPAGAARASQAVPVSYVIFDVLWADGVSLVAAPYVVRRSLLEELELAGPRWSTTPVYEDGLALLEAAELTGVEGVVAKAIGSSWGPSGRRQWVKLKTRTWKHEHAPQRRARRPEDYRSAVSRRR